VARDVLMGRKLVQALIEAGAVPEGTKRVVIEADVDGVATAYVQTYLGNAVVQVVSTMKGFRVRVVDRPEEPGGR
jgi:hypothetical protein